MLARYIKAQIIVLLCGGVLGPIWIVAYFMLPNLLGSFGPDVSSMWQSNTSWMLWAGLLITIADVLVALWLANRNARSSTKSAALHQTGVLTTAQIQGLQETGMRINERPVVNLDLHIAGPGFEFDDRKRVTRRHLQAGHRHGTQTCRAGGPEHARLRDRVAGQRVDRGRGSCAVRDRRGQQDL